MGWLRTQWKQGVYDGENEVSNALARNAGPNYFLEVRYDKFEAPIFPCSLGRSLEHLNCRLGWHPKMWMRISQASFFPSTHLSFAYSFASWDLKNQPTFEWHSHFLWLWLWEKEDLTEPSNGDQVNYTILELSRTTTMHECWDRKVLSVPKVMKKCPCLPFVRCVGKNWFDLRNDRSRVQKNLPENWNFVIPGTKKGCAMMLLSLLKVHASLDLKTLV